MEQLALEIGGVHPITSTEMVAGSVFSQLPSPTNFRPQLAAVALQMMQQMASEPDMLDEANTLHQIAAIKLTSASQLSSAAHRAQQAQKDAKRRKCVPDSALQHLKDRAAGMANLDDSTAKQKAITAYDKAADKQAEYHKFAALHVQAAEEEQQLHEKIGLAALERHRRAIMELKKGIPVDGAKFEQFCVQQVQQAVLDAGRPKLDVFGSVAVQGTNLANQLSMSNTKMELDVVVVRGVDEEEPAVLWVGEAKHNVADVLHDLKALSALSRLINHEQFEWIDLVIAKGAGTTSKKIRVTRAGLIALLVQPGAEAELPGMTYMARRDMRGLKDLLLPGRYSYRLLTAISEHEMFSPQLIAGFAADPTNWEQAASLLAAAAAENMISISDWLSEGHKALIAMVQAGAVLSVEWGDEEEKCGRADGESVANTSQDVSEDAQSKCEETTDRDRCNPLTRVLLSASIGVALVLFATRKK